MSEIVADLRDDLVSDLSGIEIWTPDGLGWTSIGEANAALIADVVLNTMTRWCAKEPTNDN